ncbi:polysaccharide biosynthesis C-terminal domain-containing protein, partial [bacterium]|nr:polysaccharide biosynthesis C-terminal domain-containing protein [bacterium]
ALYKKKTLLVSINSLIAGILNIILNYIFIPKYGIFAAAFTTMVSFFFLAILHYINARFILKEEVIPIKIFLPGLLLVLLTLPVFYLLNNINLPYFFSLFVKISFFLIIMFIFFKRSNNLSMAERK